MEFLRQLIVFTYAFILALVPATKYVEGVVGQPQSFLPSQTKTQNDKTISSLIYRGLFKYDIYGSTIPDLAETWSVSPDGLIYTIKLKDNQHWSDGRKITSDDLLYTSYKVSDLSGVATDKVDDLTVRYTLPNKYAPFLSLMTVGIMPANAEEKMNPLEPISSGDFRVARVEVSGKLIKQVVLVSSNDSLDVKKIVFRYYSNEEELEVAAKLGEIDGFISTEDVDIPNFKDHKFPLQGIYYALFLNLRNDKLKDLNLRQKLEKVLPVDDLTLEKGILVQGPISRSLFTDKNLQFDTYDEKIKETTTPPLNLTITVPDVATHRELASRIRNFWEDSLGVTVTIKKIDPNKIVKDVVEPRNFEILLFGQEVGRDPDRYVLWHSTQKDPPGLNITGFEHVRADRALEEGRNELDNDKRVVHYNEFQKVLTEQTPAIFLYHPFVHYYVSKYIDGIGEKYTFTYADRFLDLANWKRVKTN